MGENPFIDADAPPPPSLRYRLTLKNTGEVIAVDPGQLPNHHDGHSGSILSLLLEAGIDIDHSCGGVCVMDTGGGGVPPYAPAHARLCKRPPTHLESYEILAQGSPSC